MDSFVPLHVVEELLIRSDAYTICRHAFVCRDWNKLITDPDFISRHSNQTFDSRNQLLAIKVCPCKESARNVVRAFIDFPHCQVTYSLHRDNEQFDLIRAIEYPNIDDFKDIKVIGASNGLLCLVDKSSFKFILWNPAVRRYVCLPSHMPCDENLCHVGFGFDRAINDFKIVELVHRSIDDYSIRIDFAWVFSYATWSWKRVACTVPSCYIPSDSYPCVFFNGVIHWIADGVEGEGEDAEMFILTFDLAHEEFRQILFPENLDDTDQGHDLMSLATTGDSLLLLQETAIYDGSQEEEILFFSVWVMSNCGSWEKIPSTAEWLPDHILGAMKNGHLMLEMDGGQVHRYDAATSTSNLVEALDNVIFLRYHPESLYLLEKGNDVNSY